jgi:ParB family chromosome partitioning protein
MAPEKTPRRLGRGLDALFNTQPATPEESENGLKEIRLDQIERNPFQPRKEFSAEALKELQDSMSSSGLLQPITVRHTRKPDQYELVTGERRLRAAGQLGWATISCIVRDVDDRELLGLALVENLQRTDLNPIEEAEGYSQLITEFGHTQQTIATMVGRDRSTVANMLRILQLPPGVRQMLRAGLINIGHARPLLGLADESKITELANETVKKSLSAREVEQRVRVSSEKPGKRKRGRPHKADSRSPEVRNLEERLRRYLQTDVEITATSSFRGVIRISFYSADDLERVTELIKSTTYQQ